MPMIDAGRDQRVALEIDGLAIVGRRHPHISDQHVRQNPESMSRRLHLSDRVCRLGRGGHGSDKAQVWGVAYHVFAARLNQQLINQLKIRANQQRSLIQGFVRQRLHDSLLLAGKVDTL